jgi:hypothetical protein
LKVKRPKQTTRFSNEQLKGLAAENLEMLREYNAAWGGQATLEHCYVGHLADEEAVSAVGDLIVENWQLLQRRKGKASRYFSYDLTIMPHNPVNQKEHNIRIEPSQWAAFCARVPGVGPLLREMVPILQKEAGAHPGTFEIEELADVKGYNLHDPLRPCQLKSCIEVHYLLQNDDTLDATTYDVHQDHDSKASHNSAKTRPGITIVLACKTTGVKTGVSVMGDKTSSGAKAVGEYDRAGAFAVFLSDVWHRFEYPSDDSRPFNADKLVFFLAALSESGHRAAARAGGP